ncbi:MAG: guanylate kinase [Crocinitomicaceae bacterium]|jgi:guanylate kinase|nr:guanylate kinase [Crocinitomicaceae bacterium]
MELKQNGKCIIFSAPSGAGKTTIVHHLLSKNLGLEFSISACSRDPRPNEVDKKDYHFLGIDGFKDKIKEQAFVEWEEVYTNNFYGTLKSEMERIWSEGKAVIFDVDVIGGLNIKKQFGDNAYSIFVKPPSYEELEKRLRGRSTESEDKINQRMEKASKELAFSSEFDCILINDNLDEACVKAEQLVIDFLEK